MLHRPVRHTEFLAIAALALQVSVGPAAGAPQAVQPPSEGPQAPGGPDGKGRQVTIPLTESYPDEPRIEIARRLLASEQYAEARVVLETVLAQRPDIGRARFFLGVALVKMKQYELARPELERSIQLNQSFPERKHAAHFLGWASYHLGDLDRAKSDFEAHLAASPGEPDSTFALGLIAFDQDRLDDAEKHLARAIELQQGPKASKRDLAKAWARLGDVSMRRDEAGKAEERFMSSLALYPDHPEVWAKLARSRDRLGKTKEAESARNEEIRARERVLKRQPEVSAPPPQPNAPPPGQPTDAAEPVKPNQPQPSTPAKAPTVPKD